MAVAVNLLLALAYGALLLFSWADWRDALPTALQFIPEDSDQVFRWWLWGSAAAGASSFLVYLFSLFVRRERRPLPSLYLIAVAPAAPLASIFGAEIPRDSSLLASLEIAGVLLAAPLAIFAVEFLLGSIAKGLAALAEKAGLQSAAGNLFRCARLFEPGNMALARRQGMIDYRRGAYLRARPLFELLYAKGGTDRRVLGFLETCYRQEEAWDKDVECLERLLKDNPKDSTLLRRLSDAYEQLERWEDALQIRTTKLAPTDKSHAAEVAVLAMRCEKWDVAAAHCRKFRDLEGRPYRKTAELFDRLIMSGPESPDVLEDRADLLAETSEEPKAARLWERILESHPQRHETRGRLAGYLKRAGDLDKEEVHLRRLADEDAADGALFFRLSENLSEQGCQEDARELLSQGIEKYPDEFRFPFAFCQLCLDQGDIDAAQEKLEQAKSLASDEDKARASALENRIAAERNKREIDGIRAKVQANPQSVEIRLELIDRLAALGELAQARTEFDQLLKSRPEAREQILGELDRLIGEIEQNYLLLDYKADLFFQQKDFEQTLATYETMAAQSIHGPESLRQGCEKLLQADPGFLPALRRLGQIALEAGQWEQAIDIARQLQNHPGSDSLELGKALFRAQMGLNNEAEARRHGAAILKAEPDNFEVRQSMVELCERAKRFAEALDVFQYFLDHDPDDIKLRSKKRDLTWKRQRQRMDEIGRDLGESDDQGQLHLELAELHQGFNEIDSAITHYQKAARDDGLQNLATARLGHCLARKEMFDLAGETLAGVELKIGDGKEDHEIKQLVYEAALMFEASDHPKRAVDLYKTIFRVDASFRDIVARIGRFGG